MTGKLDSSMILLAKAVWCIGKFFCRIMHQRNIWTGRHFGNQLQKLRKNPMHNLPERWRWHCQWSFPENYNLQLLGSMFNSILCQRVCVRILPFMIREMAILMLTFSLLPDRSKQMAHGEQRRKRIMPEMKMETVYPSLIKRRESRN